MVILALGALTYLGGCFVGSALLVRLMPDSASAETLRRYLAVFIIFPILLVAEMVLLCAQGAMALTRWSIGAFELISGRPQRRRVRSYYGYGYRSKRRAR